MMMRIKNRIPETRKMCIVQRNGEPIHKAYMENGKWYSIRGGQGSVTDINENDRWRYETEEV